MAAMTLDLEIWVENQDEPLLVRADQRDMAAFEREYKLGTSQAMESMTMTFFRYVGWAACKRLGKADKPFDQWDKLIISVEPPDEEDVAAPDPTNPAA
jgi:hypothetical protein